jgi:predicted nucleic acid-binding protein
MPVLDASMALSWLLERDTASERSRAVRALDRLESEPAVVPALWSAEVLNALLVAERRKFLMPAQSAEYLEHLTLLPITVDTASPIARRDAVMALGRQLGLSAYDATYLELAMRVGAQLATFDQHLAKAAIGIGIGVL